MDYKQILKKALFIVALIIILSGIICYFHARTSLQQQTYDALKEAINLDYHNRKATIQQYGSKDPHPNRKIKKYGFYMNGSTYCVIFKDSIYTSIADQYIAQYQMAMTSSHAIRPDELASVFQNKLSLKEYPCGIIYRYKNSIQYSQSDSITPQAAFCTPIKSLDFANTVRVQGWVDYDWLAPIRYMPDNYRIILMLEVIVLLTLSLLLRFKNRLPQTLEQQNEPSTKEPDIYIDWKYKVAIIHGQPHQMRKLDMQILALFLNSDNGLVTREDIKKQFWPNNDTESANKKINTHISFIRKELQDTSYQITTVKEKGYKLERPGNDNNPTL